MNFTENLLCTGLAMRPDTVAVTAFREGLKDETELTYTDLEMKVAIWANALRKLGVRVGDRVASKKNQAPVPITVRCSSIKHSGAKENQVENADDWNCYSCAYKFH